MSLKHSSPLRASAVSALALLAFTCGCAGGPGKPEAERRIPADLSFHHSLRSDDHVRPFSQEDFPMPDGAEAVMRIIPFATSQPPGENRTLALVEVRIRAARPEDPQGGKGACVRDAMLTVKAAPGFTLLSLYGPVQADSGTEVRRVKLGDLKPGERRFFLAELDASREGGRQRLLGTTFRCARVADGMLFETLEGLSFEWQNPEANAKVNKWAARNSLILADAEALIKVGRLVEAGEKADLEMAVSLVDLQLNSIELLLASDAEGLGRERELFLQVRGQLANRIKAKNANGDSPASRPMVALADRPGQGIALASHVPVGPWTTLARLLVIPQQ